VSKAQQAVEKALAEFQAGHPEKAKTTLRTLLTRQPTEPNANKLLALIHGALHEDAQALFCLERAIAGDPRDAALRLMRGNALMLLKRPEEAALAFRAAVEADPHDAPARDGLARCLLASGDTAGAVHVYEEAIAALPGAPEPHGRLADALVATGDMNGALKAARRAVEHFPDNFELQFFLTSTMNFADGVTREERRDAHARLGALIACDREVAAFTNARDPDRRLAVAFVSTDFHVHSCAFFLEPLLANLDKDKVDIFLYRTGGDQDEYTARFLKYGHWRDCRGMDGERFAAAARADGIDIAVECVGWTSVPTLRLLVPRIAPVQATYLGYPNTTGLKCIDWRIVDALTDPLGSEDLHTEKLSRLDGCFVCFRPPTPCPEPAESPALRGEGPITFGSFNRVTKASDTAVRLWAGVLNAVPGSRMVFKGKSWTPEWKAGFERRFAALGVDPTRLVQLDMKATTEEHLAQFHAVDVALDSYPYHGTTTTCEALWMGVPVVTLAGDAHLSRVGASLLTAVGTPELVANSGEEFVKIASELAADRPRLRRLHETLRETMGKSPLRDEAGFAKKFEGALRTMWREWCGAVS